MTDNRIIQEAVDFNSKLKKIAYKNNIQINNESSFMNCIKNRNNNPAILPLAVCFISDKEYMKRLYFRHCSRVQCGDISRYILARKDYDDFYKKYRSICSNYVKDINKESEENLYYRIEKLVLKYYKRNNDNETIQGQYEDIISDKEKMYFLQYINHYIWSKKIDIGIYLEKCSLGRKHARRYIEDMVKNIFELSDKRLIYQIEMVKEFYMVFTYKMNIELEEKYIEILSRYLIALC